ncbi:MAG: hypothetical protein MHM6MM_001812 [Cercozoa sp. M6MM]
MQEAKTADLSALSDAEFGELEKRIVAELSEARERLVIWRRPLSVLQHFSCSVASGVVDATKGALRIARTRPVLVGMLLATLGGIVAGRLIPGSHTELFDTAEAAIMWTGWWLLLGVLSSIGLGTGMHSGLLFLFPFIAKVCLAATTCGNTDFAVYGDEAFECRNSQEGHWPGYWAVFFKVAYPAFVWGAGTAIGEIPPYVVSRAAKLAGDADADDIFAEEMGMGDKDKEGSGDQQAGNWGFVNAMRDWMLKYLRSHGFWAILAFASWPNMAFDLCGIACGHFLIPFGTFFGATFLGKAVIKIGMQTAFFVALFSEHLLSAVIALLEVHAPDGIASKVDEFLEAQKRRFLEGNVSTHEEEPQPLLARAWGWFMVLFIGGFALSIVHSFAQQRQRRQDKTTVEALRTRRAKQH